MLLEIATPNNEGGKDISIAAVRFISGIEWFSVVRSSVALQMLCKCCFILSVSKYSAQNTFLFAIIIANSSCILKALFNDIQALHAISVFLTYIISFSEMCIQIIPSACQSCSSHFLCSLDLSLFLFLFLVPSFQFSICSSKPWSARRSLIVTTHDM